MPLTLFRIILLGARLFFDFQKRYLPCLSFDIGEGKGVCTNNPEVTTHFSTSYRNVPSLHSQIANSCRIPCNSNNLHHKQWYCSSKYGPHNMGWRYLQAERQYIQQFVQRIVHCHPTKQHNTGRCRLHSSRKPITYRIQRH